MQRRSVLRAACAAAVLSACGKGGQDTGAPPTTAAQPTDAPSGPVTNPVVTQVAPDAEVSLTLVSATFEQLVGEGQTFAFGLVDAANEPLKNADAELYVALAGSDPQGPYETRYEEVEGVPLGLYVTEVDLPAAGEATFVAVTADGRAGFAPVPVAEPSASQVAAPGSTAVVVKTPTVDQPGDVTALCTRQPPCGMHDISLDDALKRGRPVMLTFATPAYCQTAVCGPSVDVVERVRTEGDFGDVAWIHVEIYTDDGKTLAEAVQKWGLPSEPWLFAIGGDGKVTARADGPLLVLPDHVSSVAQGLT